MSEKKPKIYFNGLDGLRAIAAFAVVFHHIELYKYRDGISSLFDNKHLKYFIFHLGENGVFLFFVLSGFLITYLLFEEKNRHNKIYLKRFYFRRVLRIWPLYFLVFFISFFIVPYFTKRFSIFIYSPYYFAKVSDLTNYSITSFLFFVCFFPNVALLVYKIFLPGFSQAWSIGLEEQFYIFWPIIIMLNDKKKTKWMFLTIILFYCLSHYSGRYYFKTINQVFPFQYMAIGSLGAYFYKNHQNKIEKYISTPIVKFTILVLLTFLLFYNLEEEFYQKLIIAFLFLLIILLIINKNFKFLNKKVIVYLGKISFGIYLYHPIVMYIVFSFTNKYFLDNSVVYNFLSYFFIVSITILISHFSYKYFESYFLRIKDKFVKTI